jgi:8-oxo-dGTP pyrophosphatase MutT (NUDIX family)
VRERILTRLAGSRPAGDVSAAALARLPAEVADALYTEPLIPAAVLVPLIDHVDGFSLLLTERTAHLNDHPGQISFPGGRVEQADADAVATALRESGEEIGLQAGQVEIAGYLPPHAVVTGFAVTPVVGLVRPPLALTLDEFEVAEAFEVPLAFFLDPAQRRERPREVRGIELRTVEYHYAGKRIWGATAQMISMLTTIIKEI